MAIAVGSSLNLCRLSSSETRCASRRSCGSDVSRVVPARSCGSFGGASLKFVGRHHRENAVRMSRIRASVSQSLDDYRVGATNREDVPMKDLLQCLEEASAKGREASYPPCVPDLCVSQNCHRSH